MKRFLNFFHICPRCAHRSYEKLRTYSHCVNCLFIHDRTLGRELIEEKARKAFLSSMMKF